MSRLALITCGAGFVLSHLVEALLARDWRVHVIDDLSTGQLANLDHLLPDPRFGITFDSVLNAPVLEPLVARADVIYHLAAAVGVRLVVERPVRTITTNVKATEVVLDLAHRFHRPILVTSTSEVYCKLDRPLFSEDDDLVIGPTSKSRWSYAASKIIDEHLALAYARQFGLPVTVIRMFNTIGPRQTGEYGMVVPRFVRQALRGVPITVYGDGAQRRSFTWVGDVVAAMLALIEHPGAAGEVFNVGHTRDIAIADLARLIVRLADSPSEVQLVPFERAYEAGFEDMQRRMPDISKLQALIDYRPSLDLPEMLQRIIAHERRVLAAHAREEAAPRSARAHAAPQPQRQSPAAD